MSWLSDTIAGRTIVVLVLGLGSILALAHYLYQVGIEREVTSSNTERLTERLILLTSTIASLEPDKRDAAAHSMSGGPLDMHWGREPLATAGGDLDANALLLRDRLLVSSPRLGELGLIIGTDRPENAPHATVKPQDHGHTTLISLQLDDGSWLNVTLARVQSTRPTSPSLLLSAALGAFGVVLVAFLMGGWLTRPLDQLATDARQLFLTSQTVPLAETGTREVRTLASAINDLQFRIRRLVDDRTQMLAAVSHDLRTPLTRLRLRIERVPDVEARASIQTDLDEMEAMIDATLAFLRDDMVSETVEQVDIAAILQTIAADTADAGHSVDVHTPQRLVIAGRHLALKRALTNLVQNAVKYGGSAVVSLSVDGPSIRISVCDEGPGIPADKLEAVFEPFYRIEPSRGRHTGGHGLGLTVARSIARTHGGDVVLSNRTPRGLEAVLTLPIVSQSLDTSVRSRRSPMLS